MRSFSFKVLGLASVLSIASQGAFAFPYHPGKSLPAPARASAGSDRLVEELTSVDFTNIVALNNCSGSIVRFESSLGSDPAMVLTNGHCYEGGMPSAGQIILNKASTRSFTLLSSDGQSSLGKLRAQKVILSTMTGTDMTLYLLTSTYDQIEAQYGVKGLTISSKHPVAGRKVAVISGYWKKIYQCSVDGFAYQLKEDKWTMTDSIRYSKPGCEVIGGTSGSPLVDVETHELVGVNNTINESGERCTMDNPCEVTPDGVITAIKGTAYAQETYWLYSCLTPTNQVDTTQLACKRPW